MDALGRLKTGFFGIRTPLIMQSEASECGLACLAMVASHHGFETDLPSLRRRFRVSLKGLTLTAIMELGAQLKLTPRPLRLELEELDQLALPSILHWDLKHFVVIAAIKGTRVTILDPARGERTLPIAELSHHFTGVALELLPTPTFVKAKLKEHATPCMPRFPANDQDWPA